MLVKWYVKIKCKYATDECLWEMHATKKLKQNE